MKRLRALRARKRWLIEAIVGLAMIPLTALPIYLYISLTDDGYLMYLRGRYALAAPGTPGLNDEQLEQALAARARLRDLHGVPVLVYHGIGRIGSDAQGAEFVVSRERFAEHMQSLRAAGYRPLTTAQLALYLSIDPADDEIPELEVLGLPEKPVLVTFDDGRADAMIQADPILRDTSMAATMFVIGKAAHEGGFYYETKDSLRDYATSGRWELANHTYALHDQIDSRSALVTSDPQESLFGYGRRVATDIQRAQDLLEELTGSRPVAFAYPFGDWGGELAGIDEALADTLDDEFAIAFDQDEQESWRPALPGDDLFHLHRLQVEGWSGAELLAKLGDGAARADDVYDERGLGYRYSELELSLARAGTICAPLAEAPVTEVPVGENLVALTFSGGPSARTADLLDVLEGYGAAATFFVAPDAVPGHERLLRRMIVEGNELGTSTGAGDPSDEVTRGAAAIEDATGDEPCLARPALESQAEAVSEAAAEQGQSTVTWSVDPRDYDGSSPAQVTARAVYGTGPGDIVVLNDGSEVTAEALPAILEGLVARGYRFVTVSELMAWKPKPTEDCGVDLHCLEPSTPLLLAREAPVLVSAISTSTTGDYDQTRGGGKPKPRGEQPGGSAGAGAGTSGGGRGEPSPPEPTGAPAPAPESEPAPAADQSSPPADPPSTGGGTPRPEPVEEPEPPTGGGGTTPPPGGGGTTPPPPAPGGGAGGGTGGGTGGGGGGTGGGGTPPGQGGTPPGQGGTPPGQGGTPPGQGGTPPGQSGENPGQGGGRGQGQRSER
jgi:peptidoglycan/xylan/chitin deacetylase (PgdA/CDA1 family)